MVDDDGTLDVVLVTQLPPDSWCEGFAIRPNNHVLAARLDAPVVYEIDPEDPEAQPQTVFEFPGVAAALNLAPIPGRPDQYSVITSEVSDLTSTRWEGFAVWHLDLNTGGEPKATKKGEVKDIILVLGLCPVTEKFILVADSAQSCIQVLDVTTGKSSVLLSDKQSMDPEGEDAFFGVNRMCIVGNYIWYSNYSAGTIHRVPFELDNSNAHAPVRITGSVERIVDDLGHCDGFQVKPDGSAAYTLNWNTGSLVRSDLTKALSGSAASEPVLSMLVNPTCVELGPEINGKQKLFVVCCGEIDVGWINDTPTWKDIANGIDATVEIEVHSDRGSVISRTSQPV
ncbi:hypothetical protein TruAng_006305 [Truncatella angustata]|nr:hypothetical protein TruAng_006305 [Truncatella angustata]